MEVSYVFLFGRGRVASSLFLCYQYDCPASSR